MAELYSDGKSKMKIKREDGLRMKDFLKLPDLVQKYVEGLAEDHGVSLKRYLKRLNADSLEWSSDGKVYRYKRGQGVFEVSEDDSGQEILDR